MPWEDDLNNKVPPQEEVISEAKVGEPLPKWTDGCLDIHFINSGRGECAFYILPDGTTLLVDAGEVVVTDGTEVPQKPDAATRPYIVDAKYIRHFLPEGSSAIDWCAPSHFHIDHIGSSGRRHGDLAERLPSRRTHGSLRRGSVRPGAGHGLSRLQ